LQGVKPGVVVIAFSDSLWTEHSVRVGPTRATETADPRAKARYLEADLRSIVSRLRAAGHDVLLMQPLPKPWRIHGDEVDVLFDPSKCSTLSVLRSGCPKRVETSRAYEDRFQADPRSTITRVAASTGAHVVDLRDHFCSATVCSTHRGSLPLYRDGGHISVTTSDELAPTFANVIR